MARLNAQTVVTGATAVVIVVVDLATVAARQLGLITHRQARAAGLSNDAVSYRIGRGEWRRLPRGVYAIRGAPESWDQFVLAAVLACGESSFVSHATASPYWGFRGFEAPNVETTVPLGRIVRLEGIRAHRSGTLIDADVRAIGPIPIVSPARTLIDLSSRCSDARLGELVDDGLRRRVLSLGELRAIARRLPSIAPGRSPKRVERVLRTRIAGYHPGDSELESRVLRAIVAAGLPEPVRQFRVVVDDRVYFLDLAYPEPKLAIEVDGFEYHRGRDVFDRDRMRQNDLVRVGWTVLRFTSRSSDHEIVAAVRQLVFAR